MAGLPQRLVLISLNFSLVGGWAYLVPSSGSASYVTFALNYYDQNYNYITTNTAVPFSPSSSGVWTFEELTGVSIPSNVAYAPTGSGGGGATLQQNRNNAAVASNCNHALTQLSNVPH